MNWPTFQRLCKSCQCEELHFKQTRYVKNPDLQRKSVRSWLFTLHKGSFLYERIHHSVSIRNATTVVNRGSNLQNKHFLLHNFSGTQLRAKGIATGLLVESSQVFCYVTESTWKLQQRNCYRSKGTQFGPKWCVPGQLICLLCNSIFMIIE